MIALKIIQALVVRFALVLHCILAIWRVTVMYENIMWWFMASALLPLVVETWFTIIKRHGDEFLWCTPCFFFYLCATVPCVWLLELDKSDSYKKGNIEEYNEPENKTVGNLLIPLSLNLNPNTWTIIIEEMLLYLLIVSRWVLPRGQVTREQLSELMFAFIGIASDIMEMFSLFGESVVRNNLYMAYWILSVWSLSVLQFCMTITVTHQPRKAKNIKVIVNQDEEHERQKIRNEVFAIVMSMLIQDVPFVTLRLYTIVTYKIINYSLIFFTAKNCLVIMLLLYKIAVLIQKRYCPELERNDDDDEIIGKEGDIDSNRNMIGKQRVADSGFIYNGGDQYIMGNDKQAMTTSPRNDGINQSSVDTPGLKKRKGVEKSYTKSRKVQKNKKGKEKSRQSKSAGVPPQINSKAIEENPTVEPYTISDANLDSTNVSERTYTGRPEHGSPTDSKTSSKGHKSNVSSEVNGNHVHVSPHSQTSLDPGFGWVDVERSHSVATAAPLTPPSSMSGTAQELTHSETRPTAADNTPDTQSVSYSSPQVSSPSRTSDLPAPTHVPQPTTEYASQPTPQYAPQPTTEYAPQPTQQYVPQPTTEYASHPTPQPTPQYAPQPTKQDVPKPGDPDFKPYVTVIRF